MELVRPPKKASRGWNLGTSSKECTRGRGTRFKFINKFSLSETCKMAVALQNFRLASVSHLTVGFVTENRAQNKLEYQQALYFYPLEN